MPWILTSLSVLVCLRCHHESFRVLLLNLCELRVGFSSFFWLVFLRLFLLVGVVVVVVVFFLIVNLCLRCLLELILGSWLI